MNSARLHARYIVVAVLTVAWAAAYLSFGPMKSHAAEESLLGGKVTSSQGAAVAAIPVRARRANSNITVSVYTNSRGEYSFPGWSDVAPGTHTVSIELPDFEPTKRDAVLLSAGKTAKLDFNLQPRQPLVNEAAIADIVMGLPGTDEQKFLLAQCGHCHSLLGAELRLRPLREHAHNRGHQVQRAHAEPEHQPAQQPGHQHRVHV